MDKDTLPQHKLANNNPAAEGSAPADTVSARRRKLIRASAAAVPAIMTLRTGSAAAIASIHGCIERDAAEARVTLGPEDNVYGDDPSEATHDQWARVVGRAGCKVTISAGSSDNTTVLYCIRNTVSTPNWDDIEGWDCYDSSYNQVNNNSIKNKWDTADKLKFYSVNETTGWKHINEVGQDMVPEPTIPASALNDGRDVLLLLYVATYEGEIIGGTYYPRIAAVSDQVASPITDSCLCSVDPNGNFLGLG